MQEEENIARLFHEIYEKLAPSFLYSTREATKTFDTSSNNGKLMIAVSKEVLTIIKKRYNIS